jgi:hypothetical protein
VLGEQLEAEAEVKDNKQLMRHRLPIMEDLAEPGEAEAQSHLELMFSCFRTKLTFSKLELEELLVKLAV